MARMLSLIAALAMVACGELPPETQSPVGSDFDGDGYTADVDCNDLMATVNPGATEDCSTEYDDDCDGQANENCVGDPTDADNDGWSIPDDCNDGNATVFPGAPELCDGIDNNCNTVADDNPVGGTTFYIDVDGDGHGRASGAVVRCSQPAGYAPVGDDCDDGNPLRFPGNPEVCTNGIDDDCDGLVDYADVQSCVAADPDDDEDGFTVGEGDCNDQNDAVYPGAAEICDGLDNDCNPVTVETPITWYYDADGDGVAGPTINIAQCNDPGDRWYETDGDACDDDRDSYPGNVELCNGIDDDCDALVDEGLTACNPTGDADDDGFTVAEGDCDDNDDMVYPGATEACNNGIDDDCDDLVDSDDGDCVTTTDPDADNDGWTVGEGDCDDANGAINPGATETCGDTVDMDCDGDINPESGCETCARDADGDGYGTTQTSERLTCNSGWVADGGYEDCDDTAAAVNPGATEACGTTGNGDGIDNDCNGTVDEGCNTTPTRACYPDADGDGFGRNGSTAVNRTACHDNESEYRGDCNDGNATVYNGAPELADGIDNDCDGTVDEGASLVYLDRWFCNWNGDAVTGEAIGDWEHGYGPLPSNSHCVYDDKFVELYPNSLGGQLTAVRQCRVVMQSHHSWGATHNWRVARVGLATHPDVQNTGVTCTTLGYASTTPRQGWVPIYLKSSPPMTSTGNERPGHGDVMLTHDWREASFTCNPSYGGGADGDYDEAGENHVNLETSCSGTPIQRMYVPGAGTHN